ncbi:beta-galactosidase [Cryobacterium sp. 10S3]|nr:MULTISPECIES: beta-galactosidase [unclassified Cryobacterium]MDY7528820.1 beta-galactosidase [Cryobacterium sp. 10C2]MDY7555439.1 beta-galactosidase [Cryobacterium sp. 10C3]MEB0201015.1 beta-galactosidase [Cryobacterium sp. 5I3]MEB0285209.1 beta-galactosidase [Cryobacterium sp. 10S3]MEB0290840.1 beta-galactosidase [Cryobacterium sp. 10C2]
MPGTTSLRYGGDYNPEQWPREVWLEDIALMKQAGINLVSLGIFSWVLLEPREGEYDFAWLDDLFELLHAAGIDIDLATPTAAPPAWFWKKYPAAHPVTRDGVHLAGGSRGVVSPSSPEYRRAAANITEQLARRYAGHPALVLWHVHNEYGAPISESYDDYSVAAFRLWLQKRYGTLRALNDAWGTTFWGQRYGEWDEINAPRLSASVTNQAQRLDFKRFSSDALLACFINERDTIRRFTPDIPVTTNFMATNCLSANYWTWSREVDIVSNDHYLVAERADNHILLAMDADLTRSLAGGAPWILMEHSTGAVNWQPRNIAKTAGELARNSLSHLARGADGILFFQFRASRYGAEKFHSAMLPHAGTETRAWRDVVALGATLARLEPVRASRVQARVAILWDVESFWAQDLEWRPSVELDHRERIEAFYSALWNQGVTVDFAHPAADLRGYDVVLAPSLYLLGRAAADNLTEYVRGGGTLVVSYFSGIVDEQDAVYPGAAPGALRDVLGLAIHEFRPLHENESVGLSNGRSGSGWTDDIHVSTAEVHSRYLDGPAAAGPAITRNSLGAGTAWYVSTRLIGHDLDSLLGEILTSVGVGIGSEPGIEVVTRTSAQGDFTFVINHTDADATHPASGAELITGETISGTVTVPAGLARVVHSAPTETA